MSKEETTPIPGPAGDEDAATQQYRNANWTPKSDERTQTMAEAETSYREAKSMAAASAKGYERIGEARAKVAKELADIGDEEGGTDYRKRASILKSSATQMETLADRMGRDANEVGEEAGKKFDEERQAAERVISEKPEGHDKQEAQTEVERDPGVERRLDELFPIENNRPGNAMIDLSALNKD